MDVDGDAVDDVMLSHVSCFGVLSNSWLDTRPKDSLLLLLLLLGSDHGCLQLQRDPGQALPDAGNAAAAVKAAQW